MRFHSIVRGVAYLAPLALVLTACKDSPTAEETGEPYAIVSNTSVLFLTAGDRFTIAASVIDRYNGRLAQELEVSASAGVTIDSTKYLPELAETRIFGQLNTGVSNAAQITLSAGSVDETVDVVTVSTGVVNGAAALIFRAPRDLFTDDTEVAINGTTSDVLQRSATELAVLLPFGTSGALEFELSDLIDASGASGASVAEGVPTNEDGEPNDDVSGAIELAVGAVAYGSVSADDIDDYYVIEITEAGDYEFILNWGDDSDLDGYPLDANEDLLSVAMATANHPEHVTLTLEPGTYYFDVNLWEAASDYVTYSLTVVKK